MTDTDILRKALERYRNATANNTAFKDDVIVFLEAVLQFTRDGQFIARYNSAKDASRATGANHSHILECCNGHRYKTVNGFVWEFEIKKGC